MRTRRFKLYLNSIAPEVLSVFRNGYSFRFLHKDIYAGLIVAIISFPLAVALAIASGASPEKGLVTSVVAGALTSVFGGSRFQIGGPTGAFVVIIFNIIHLYGFVGLVVATLLAGVILILSGLLGLGKIIQYMPYTVTAGFTAGIGVTILSTQLHDFFGIAARDSSGSFIERICFISQNASACSVCATILSIVIALVIFLLQKYKAAYPRFLFALIIGVAAVFLFGDSLETVGDRFADLKFGSFSLNLPDISFDVIKKLFPSALTIAFLSGIESLLCCTVADSLTATRHKSDSELIGQGISNIGSALVGGLPATGALARTAANIKAGAVSPFAGVFQALFVCSFMCFLLDYMKYVPIACLAGMLVTIAWNMIGFRQCLYIFHSSKSDLLVFLATFILTVVIDVTVGVEVGVFAAVFLFIKRISEKTEVKVSRLDSICQTMEMKCDIELNKNVQCININGPLFFGIAPVIKTVLAKACKFPKVIILNFEHVPLIDATGARIIRQLVFDSHGVTVILTNLRKYPFEYLKHLDYKNENVYGHITSDMKDAIELANKFTIDPVLEK